MRASRGLKWENKMYKPKRSIEVDSQLVVKPYNLESRSPYKLKTLPEHQLFQYRYQMRILVSAAAYIK